MPSLREEITKTFRRFGRRGDSRPSAASLAETITSNDPRDGRQYGSYRILRRLGVGGMGQVYLAIDTRLGRHAALKFLDNRLLSDPAMLLRLYQEARTASSLNHPNILTIYDIGEFEGEHFIATEYVEGVTLRTALDRDLITPPVAVEIAAQVASALMAAHAAEIVHRDLKATNIMIRPDGIVKVIDFGLAKVTAARGASDFGHGPLSTPGTVAGTVEYMSPEQARGDEIDHRADLWSLGVVLYEMLYRKYPFDGTTESHVIVAILDHPLPALATSGSIPVGATKVIERALTKDRNKRYQAANAMLADLQALGIAPKRISAIRKFTVIPNTNQSRGLPVLIGISALLLALAVFWWPYHGKEKVFGPDWFEAGPPQQVTHNGHVTLAAVSPDGRYLGYVSRGGDQETLWLRKLADGSESSLSLGNNQAIGLSFPRQSGSIFYALKDRRKWGRLFSLDFSSKIPKPLLEDIDGPVTFSSDGKEFAFMRRSEDKRATYESILVAEANNIHKNESLIERPIIVRTMAWSPASDKIAAVIYNAALLGSMKPHLVLIARDGTEEEVFSSARFRSMDSPVWMAGDAMLLFAAATQGRTNQQAKLYEVSLNTKQVHEIPAPPFSFETVSATSDGQLISAVRQTRSISISVTPVETLDSGRQILPDQTNAAQAIATSFAWRDSNTLIYPTSTADGIALSDMTLDGASKRVTSVGECVDQHPAFSAAAASVVFDSNCGGDFNLWRLDLASGIRSQLTSGSNFDQRPDVTPDGKWVVYTTWPSNVPSVWKVSINGGVPQQLTNLQAQNPVVSPDGKYFACQIRESVDGLNRVAILAISSGAIVKEFPEIPITDATVRWSPDGRSLDFLDSDRTRISRLPVNGGKAQVLTQTTKYPILDFSWSPDGRKLATLTARSESDVIFLKRSGQKSNTN